MDATKYPHPPHRTQAGDAFHIDGDGTFVHLSFAGGAKTVELTGFEARQLRDWLTAAELRTPAEAAALVPPKASQN